MFLLHVCHHTRPQALQGLRLPDWFLTSLEFGRAPGSQCVLSVHWTVEKWEGCFCSKYPLGGHLSPTLLCISPGPEWSAAPCIYSQLRTSRLVLVKRRWWRYLCPWKLSPAFFFLSRIDWWRLRGHMLGFYSFLFHSVREVCHCCEVRGWAEGQP